MKAYYSLFKMRILKGLQYRAAALAGISTQFFWGIITIMIFQAFYSSSTRVQPISFGELVQVTWLQQSFLVFVMLWFRDTELFNLITNGNIAYELCKPINLYNLWYAKLIAQRLSGAALRSLPIIFIASLLRSPYNFTLPKTLAAFLLFLIALVLGLLLVTTISMFIYIFTFYTMSPSGSLLVFGVIGEFFSGLVIPIPLMPDLIKTISYVLPFRYTCDFPFRVYAGNIGTSEAIIGIGIQVIWIISLYIIGRLWMKQTLNRVVVQGG